jgi:hypothetical protein
MIFWKKLVCTSPQSLRARIFYRRILQAIKQVDFSWNDFVRNIAREDGRANFLFPISEI